MFSRPSMLVATTLVVASVCIGATIQESAKPAPASVLNSEGGPAWYRAIDIGNGVELEAWVGFTDTVIDPVTTSNARAVSLHMNFLYGVGVMQQIDSIKLHALSDADPERFQMAGIDRNIVTPQKPPLAPLGYSIVVTPKRGYTWGTIRGAVDLDIVATQT